MEGYGSLLFHFLNTAWTVPQIALGVDGGVGGAVPDITAFTGEPGAIGNGEGAKPLPLCGLSIALSAQIVQAVNHRPRRQGRNVPIRRGRPLPPRGDRDSRIADRQLPPETLDEERHGPLVNDAARRLQIQPHRALVGTVGHAWLHIKIDDNRL